MMICIPKHNPNSDPKFHHVLMFDGVGKSISALFIILISGWFFRIGLFIILIFVMVLLRCL